MSEVVIFLEPKGTVLEVLREAKRRGYAAIAVVTDPGVLQTLAAPYDSAVSCIDRLFRIESWNDTERLLRLVENILERNQVVAGVFSGIEACAVPSALLRQRFQLPTPDAKVLELIINKHQLRLRLRELGLSRIRTFCGATVDTWANWEIGGPAYFKPERGVASMYVQRCTNLADLQRAKWNWKEDTKPVPKYIADYVRSRPEYHLEDAFEGELMSVEAISFRGQFHCIGLTSRILYSRNPIVEMGSCFPYPHPLTDEILSLVTRAHAGLEFTDGPSHTEVIVNSKGEIEIIDFNPRFIGADVLQSINFAYGIRIESALLDWAVGREPVIKPAHSFFSCMQYLLPPGPIVFESVEFPDTPEVKFHTSFVRRGTVLSSSDRQVDYLGCYLTVMPDFTAAVNRSRDLRRRVIINKSLLAAY